MIRSRLGADGYDGRHEPVSFIRRGGGERDWVWFPDNATVVEGDDYSILRLPDYFDHQLSVLDLPADRAARGGG